LGLVGYNTLKKDAYVSQMQNDIRSMAVAQERWVNSYGNATSAYTDNKDDLVNNKLWQQSDPGVGFDLVADGGKAWSVVARNPSKTDKECGYFTDVTSTVLLPAVGGGPLVAADQGKIVCKSP
jgi:hypothetical protein